MKKILLITLVVLCIVTPLFAKTISIDLTDEQMEMYQSVYRHTTSYGYELATEEEVEAIIAKHITGRADTDIKAQVDADWNKLSVTEKKEKLKKGNRGTI